MNEDAQTSYDRLPYESHPYERTHPDHLAVMAALFGLGAADVDRCRVLELGCAAGGNLIPQAVQLPNSSFLGVDLSRRQLSDGWQLIERLGLKNIQLEHRSITDVEPADGAFDYIICHGVYSWVARDVQDKILQICRDNLAFNGVAYVSYNTYPGWFLRGMVRQMMCFHARQFDEPDKQVQQARALLDFLINAGPGNDPTYHELLRRELEIVRNRHDSYLYHEHLEEENEPLFFYQFMERAEAAGLRFLAEVQFSEMVPGNFSPEVDKTLRELQVGLIHAEQYLDFLRNRTFRRTLLCHNEVELNRQLGQQQLKGLFVGCRLRPDDSRVNLRDSSALQFSLPSGPTVSVSQPLLKSALVQLGELWPGTVRFEDLPALAHEGLGTPLVRNAEHFAGDMSDLASLVLELYAADLIQLRVGPVRYATEVSERPAASPLARLQAEEGPLVTNLMHELIPLTDLQRCLVRMLDGSNDTEALCDKVHKLVEEGHLVVESYGKSRGREHDRTFLMELLDGELKRLAENAVLTA